MPIEELKLGEVAIDLDESKAARRLLLEAGDGGGKGAIVGQCRDDVIPFDGSFAGGFELLAIGPVDMSSPFSVGVVLAKLPQSANDLVVVSIAPRMAIDKGETGDFF